MTEAKDLQQVLRQRVERFLGKAMNSKRDFDTLSMEIFKHRKVLLSPSTLRRFWGYQEQGAHTASPTTLDTLSRLLGYAGWKAFVEATCSSTMSQNELPVTDGSEMLQTGKTILVDDLTVNTRVVVCWLPDRMVTLEFLGGEVFRVIKSENSKLQVGDTFHCKQLTEGMPLCCESLIRTDCVLMNYVGGKNGGITFNVLPEDEHK